MGRQIQGYQLFPPQILTVVLVGSVPDVPGKFDLVRFVDRVCRRIMAERERALKKDKVAFAPLAPKSRAMSHILSHDSSETAMCLRD